MGRLGQVPAWMSAPVPGGRMRGRFPVKPPPVMWQSPWMALCLRFLLGPWLYFLVSARVAVVDVRLEERLG
jgi:hypothetical protein